jgi:hypothetical protein
MEGLGSMLMRMTEGKECVIGLAGEICQVSRCEPHGPVGLLGCLRGCSMPLLYNVSGTTS